MQTVSVNYDVLWEYSKATQYKFTKAGVCINAKRCRIVKRIMKGNSVGFKLAGEFVPLSKLRKELVKITVNNNPF